MPTKSVKITETSTSIREALSTEAAPDTLREIPLSPEAEALLPHRRELDEFLFHEGTARHAYTYLGRTENRRPAQQMMRRRHQTVCGRQR